MIWVEKPAGFVGGRLTEALTARGIPWQALMDRPSGERPSGVIFLNRWYSVPSTTARSARSEAERSLLPLLELVDRLDWRRSSHVVFVSSAGAVYGPGPDPSTEMAQPLPTSNYGAAKLAAESFLAAAAVRHRFPLTVLRPSNLFGPGQPARPGFGIVPALHRSLVEGSAIEYWPGSEVRKDYLYIDDFIDALMCVLLEPPDDAPVRVYNIASGHCASVPELRSIALQVVHGRVPPPTAASGPAAPAIAPDARRFSERYGWQPRHALSAGLRATFAWLDGRVRRNVDG